MKDNLRIAFLFTLVTTIVFGVLYPLSVTGIAQLLFPTQANGSLIEKDRRVVGSRLLGQMFSSPGYFRPRPSGAGAGYDASQSGSPNLAPTNHALIERVKGDVAKLRAENSGAAIPVDLVTTSASGLDPEISPEAAAFQIPRVARERGISEENVRTLVSKHTLGRQFHFLGEPRVRVLELNLDLDATRPMPR